jgi:arylsulfatase A-like enzyme
MSTPKRAIGLALAFAALACARPSTPSAIGSAAPAQPNVVIFLADDLGSADVGYRGGPIATPNLDRLAREGLRLDHFYTAPICSPTRAMLLTGRDPIRMGLAYDQINPWDSAGLPANEHTMAESFQAAGYQTAIVGKWHLGHAQETYHPLRRGFDHFYGHLNTAVDYWQHARMLGHDWQRDGRSLDERGRHATELEAAEAARVIRERDPSRPLFLYVAWSAPHNPLQERDELVAKYAQLGEKSDPPGYLAAISPVPPELRERYARFRRLYAAMVEGMDRGVGEVLRTLDETGIARDTIVLFLSDNGGFNGFGGDNSPLRGQKLQTFEGGLRVPAVIRWPAQLEAGGVRDPVISVMDVFPTLAAASGVPLGNTLPLDGQNRWSLLRTGVGPERGGDLFFAAEVPIPGQIFTAVRSGRWKLVKIERPAGLPTLTYLFDLAADPNETTDLARHQPARLRELEERLAKWRALQPPGGLRRAALPHPGWLPPRDWAQAMRSASALQPALLPEFQDEGNDGQGVGLLLYTPPEERAQRLR